MLKQHSGEQTERYRTHRRSVDDNRHPFFLEFKNFHENLAAISSRKRSIIWNKPKLVGAALVDLAKHIMFDFHHNVIRQHFNCFVFYSDTESLLYEVKHTDFQEELTKNSKFDMTNYPTDQKLYNAHNKLVTLKLIDELGGTHIEEFVARPKAKNVFHLGRWEAKVISKRRQQSRSTKPNT